MDETGVNFERIDWQPGASGVRYKAAVRDRKQMRLIEIDPQAPQEWCVTGHVGYVLEGTLEIEFAGGVRRFAAGEGFILRAGEAERHRPKAIGGIVKLLTVEDL